MNQLINGIISSSNWSCITDIKIRYEKGNSFLYEGIKYKLYQEGHDFSNIYTSFIKYRRTKRGEHSYDLERIDGSTEIVKGSIIFSWSYESENEVYLYLNDGTKIKKINNV